MRGHLVCIFGLESILGLGPSGVPPKPCLGRDQAGRGKKGHVWKALLTFTVTKGSLGPGAP